MNHQKMDGRVLAAALLLGAGLLEACSSGSGGSNVGAGSNIAPTARAQVLNGGESSSFREGSEVLLTGKDSEDGDGPLIGWSWAQTAGPAVQLIEVNSTTVSFTAPDIAAETVLSFQLTVEDTDQLTSNASVDVAVVPAQDADKFLSLDLRAPVRDTFDTFDVVAALAEGASTGNGAKPFTLAVQAHLVYPPRSNPNIGCPIDLVEFAAGIPSTTASGCFVELLEELTPAGGVDGEWPANVTAEVRGMGPTPEQMRGEWWNPRFTFKVPRLDVADFNQQFIDAGDRSRLLDLFNAHEAWILLSFELTAPENQQWATLVLNSYEGEARVVANDQAGLPTSLIVPLEEILASIDRRESALSAEVYYRTIDPFGSRFTLNSWLQQAGFSSDGQGTLLQAAVDGTGEFAHAVYVNNYDLGFGRDMYSRVDEFGNVYSFVVNYSTLEAAIRKNAPIVTVVMEYSALNGPMDPTEKFVKFFTYVDDGSGDSRRVTSMNFDGRGERSTPGNCVACHGGVLPPGLDELDFDDICGNRLDAMCYSWPDTIRTDVEVANGNLSSTFLPWDLSSLLFADTDPAITDAPQRFDGLSLGERLIRDYGDFSRTAQEGQMKKLNEAAYATYCSEPDCPTSAARALVEHWYGGADLPESVFDDSQAPPGWQNGETVSTPTANDPGATSTNPETAEEIYHTVFAQHCRMCHTNIGEPSLQFDNYQKFLLQKDLIKNVAFVQGVMPGARLTMDRFWVPFSGSAVAGEVLAEHFEAIDGQPPTLPPGVATAQILGFDNPPARGAVVRLDGSGSLFADTYQWSLETPAGSSAVLVGNSGRYPAFLADVPGEYRLSLVINAGTASEAEAQKTQVVANRSPQAVDDVFTLVLEDTDTVEGSVLEGDNQDSDPDGDPLTVSLLANGLPEFGDVVLSADGFFTYTFTEDPFNPPAASDSFDYQLSDGFGGTDQGSVTIALLAAPDTVAPSVPNLQSVTDVSTADGADSEFAAELSWLASSDDNEVIGYNIRRTPGPAEPVFHASSAAAGSVVTFVDTTVEPDQTYEYTVAARDAAANESGPSAPQSVTLVTSYRVNIHTGWGDQNGSIWELPAAGCTGCHGDGESGGLKLTGDADMVLAELREDQNDPFPRRLEPGNPTASLILCKASDTCDVSHSPPRLPTDGAEYQTILRWITDGAPDN
jgi:mono/diheme cytochrome c family protein